MWTVIAVSVCGQLDLCQCVDSESWVSVWTVRAGSGVDSDSCVSVWTVSAVSQCEQ